MGFLRGEPCVLATLLLGALSGCARCNDEPRVPFKLPGLGASDAASADAAIAVDAAAPSLVFAPPVDRPLLAGSALALGRVHAVLESDLDGDGDRDALVLSEDDLQQPRLHAVTREPDAFAAPRAITQFTQAPAPGCSIASARIDALSPTKAVATLTRACSAEAATSTSPTSEWLLSLEATPRVFERIDLPSGDAPALSLRSVPRSVDADGDGHDDVALDIALASAPAGAGDAVPLIWLDRPSGLVRDAREPDATLTAWATAAQALAGKDPAAAVARAELALTLGRALCRELGTPRVRVSGGAGIACGALKSSAMLLSTLLTAHVKRGALAAAFDAYRSLRTLDPPADARTLSQAASTLAQLRATSGVSLRRLGTVDTFGAPRVHLPRARFLSDASLYVRRAVPVLIDLDRNEETPAPSVADDLVRDPTGQLIASMIERGCDGHAVRIERAPPRGSDYVASPAVGAAPLAATTTATPCTRSGARADDGGFTLLGWAPQGLLAARGSELRLIPLASDGRPLGPPRVLAPDAPRPAPVPAGVATSDASRYVEPTPAGLLVFGPSSADLALWRPDGYAAIAKGPLEAAVSPTGRRVALVAGGSVYVLERP